MLFGVSVYAESDVMIISYSGITDQAGNVGTGKGVSFILPDLSDEDFYIYAVELAVFEKKEGETQWSIYKNENGEESKKQYIENPESLIFNVDFGSPQDYSERARYKIGYRYYVKCIFDESLLMIAGEDIKDGWRLVGENNPTAASGDGLCFYRNSEPNAELEGVIYKCHSIEGLSEREIAAYELASVTLPKDVFGNGVYLKVRTDDYDGDYVSVHYKLVNDSNGNVLAEGSLTENTAVTTTQRTSKYRLYITVADEFGSSVSLEPYIITLDLNSPTVNGKFNDGGFALMGQNLFSDFYIYDDNSTTMEKGKVYAEIYLNNEYMNTVELTHMGNGVYRLDETEMPDGSYKVNLKIYDKSGNYSESVFRQKLDNTPPELTILTPEEDAQSTQFYTWMNECKKIVISASDNLAGIQRYSSIVNSAQGYSGAWSNYELYQKIYVGVTTRYTGKLRYVTSVYDGAKLIDKEKNMYNTSTAGNCGKVTCEVWIDKNKPVITVSETDEAWIEAPHTIYASFNDYPTSNLVNDVSGIIEKMYAVTTSSDETPDWKVYDEGIPLTQSGVYYVYFKARDAAGNEEMVMRRVRLNTLCRIVGRVRPTENYTHTIYYGVPGFYVVKNTAYNTKYHFELKDEDIYDVIKISVKLVNQDNGSIYGLSECVSQPSGSEERDIVFNMPYLDSQLDELPDGVYDMLITIEEHKNDGEKVMAHVNVKDCEVVIKRNAPPTPIINTSGNKVSIVYPDEPLAGSLNNAIVKSHYKCQYKTVRDGEAETNVYRTYTGEFDADNFIVTALYTDIAGNTSVATKRIYASGDTGGAFGDILTSGDTATVDESRVADVYYIGVRREKQGGIDNSVFGFID